MIGVDIGTRYDGIEILIVTEEIIYILFKFVVYSKILLLYSVQTVTFGIPRSLAEDLDLGIAGIE